MIVGTAGHIDHGKTALVRALTGIDADRLPEEKTRGMTIDRGFAFAGIPFHHHLHQLVFELPGGVLGDAEAAAEFEAGDPALALRQLVHGA